MLDGMLNQGRLQMLTGRYDEAFRYAHELHGSQKRKGGPIPYISHLMIVSALVLENEGTEDQAIAALLHDAAEDQGGAPTLEVVRIRFGDVVAEIVSDCTDSWPEEKQDWQPRKKAYLAKLPAKPRRSLLVSLADKTHNAEAILSDYRVLNDALWDRFSGGAAGTRWYYQSLANIFSQVMPGRLSDRLSRAATAFSV
jgi:(p)ppGpp synthase/HD superfamily hydrolase